MSIKIIKPGILTTLQDSGRTGCRSIGVGTGGAMDIFAMSLANYLVGNDVQHAVIEIHFPSPEIFFEEDAIIAITGASFSAVVDDIAIPVWNSVLVKKSSSLKFTKPVFGARAYLAVLGGWEAEKWLNSFSTYLKLSVGGYSGRAIQKNDRLFFPPVQQAIAVTKLLSTPLAFQQIEEIYQPASEIRCIKGADHELLSERGKEKFEKQDFTISHQSDRMGYRLNAQPIILENTIEMISSPVDAGTIQLLPDGNCVVLMADHQTTGGYPRIASVIKADLPKLAQARPGQSIHFKMISLSEAEELYLRMKKTMDEIKLACQAYLNKINNPDGY